MATMTTTTRTVNRNAPSEADRRWWAAQSTDHHTTEPTPVEALTEPWASWPAWTDEVWTITDAEADELAEDFEADRRVETLGYL